MPLINNEIVLLFCFILAIIAFLYSSVGHGGASGYLAIMSVFSFSISFMKPSALLLNIFVSGVSFYFYYKKGFFKIKLFYPFIITSIPAVYIGDAIKLENAAYKVILGIVLVFAALRMLGFLNKPEKKVKPINIPLAMAIGFFIGILSGMLGIGGGIILSPVILILGWATLKETAAISSLFIFLNSLAGISSYFYNAKVFPSEAFYMVPVALVGGMLGACYGSGYFPNKVIKAVLASVILMASFKLIV
jgi:uncharacterized protein